MNIRLLLDANLSWRSVSILKMFFDDCFHVDSIGLHVPAKDMEIWQYAKKQIEEFILSSEYGLLEII